MPAVTASNSRGRHPTHLAGCIKWLPPKDELSSVPKGFDEGGLNHPVVVLSPKSQNGKVTILIMTSFGGIDLKTKHASSHKKRIEYLPVKPCDPHPDNGILLKLSNHPSGMPRKTYVHTTDSRLVRLDMLRVFKPQGVELSLSPESYRQLADYAKFNAPAPRPQTVSVFVPVTVPVSVPIPAAAAAIAPPRTPTRAATWAAAASSQRTTPPPPSSVRRGSEAAVPRADKAATLESSRLGVRTPPATPPPPPQRRQQQLSPEDFDRYRQRMAAVLAMRAELEAERQPLLRPATTTTTTPTTTAHRGYGYGYEPDTARYVSSTRTEAAATAAAAADDDEEPSSSSGCSRFARFLWVALRLAVGVLACYGVYRGYAWATAAIAEAGRRATAFAAEGGIQGLMGRRIAAAVVGKRLLWGEGGA
ncbi:hypothetical protein F5X96DRAFT_420645 [Biscogniauxia mediterranea]|nr:hypothetical protein F5X96DRAFT_420645 [Biscogniauxia mediterranea]